MTFHFAWVDSSETGFTDAMQRQDEEVLSFVIDQQEGDFASLAIEVRNPRIGLLNIGRKRWAWFAVDETPLFFGRLVGLPEAMQDDVVSLTFVAKPLNFQTAKSAVAAGMKQLEYFDPLFIEKARVGEADTVLEGRPMVWFIDRVTHAVGVSHITTGEEGTLDFAGHVLEDSVQCSFTGAPQRKVVISAAVSWTQRGRGTLRRNWGSVKTYTGDGLLADWPKAGQNIGGGWSVTGGFAKDRYSELNSVNVGTDEQTNYRLYWYNITGWVDFTYDAERDYRELATFTMTSDVQEIVTETGDEEPITLSVSGDADAPVDAGGAMPIVDLRRRSYFSTERGNMSVAYLANVASARLLAAARCVEITFEVPFSHAASLSLRKSGRIADARLPGGEATGKIKSYSISGSGDRAEFKCSVTLACTPGYGNPAPTAAGLPAYADNYADTYQAQTGATQTIVTAPDSGDPAMTITNFDQTMIDDDGLDLFNMTLANCVTYEHVFNEQHDQTSCIMPSAFDTNERLSTNYTYITMEFRPVNNGPFATAYSITCSPLSVPKTIDLEAGSS